MTTNAQELAGIRERHNERQRKINNAAEAAARGDNLAKLCHGRCKEHDDRATLLAIVDRQAARLERVEEFARDLERKGKDVREKIRQENSLAWACEHMRLTAKASTYEAEARSLRQILEGK